MEKEVITMLVQLLTAMKDTVNELDKAQSKKDMERISQLKKEILNLKGQIDKLL